MLGIPKADNRTQQGKGSLANKIPVPVNALVAAQQTTPTVVNNALLIVAPNVPIQPASLPPVVQKVLLCSNNHHTH